MIDVVFDASKRDEHTHNQSFAQKKKKINTLDFNNDTRHKENRGINLDDSYNFGKRGFYPHATTSTTSNQLKRGLDLKQDE